MGQSEYLDPGTYTITAQGGRDVGAFSTTLPMPQPLNWTNINDVSTIQRGQSQLVTWTGGPASGFAVITGTSVGPAKSTGFTCVKRISAGSFLIPGYVSANLASISTAEDIGLLTLQSSTPDARFNAPGLDVGFLNAASATSKSVTYK